MSPLEPYAADDVKRKKRKNTLERDFSEEDALQRFVYNKEFIATLLKEIEAKKNHQSEQ